MSFRQDLTFPTLTCARRWRELSVLGPLVLSADLLLLLGSEIVGDVESLADLVRRLALDHVGDSLAANVEKGFDIEIVRGLEVVR